MGSDPSPKGHSPHPTPARPPLGLPLDNCYDPHVPATPCLCPAHPPCLNISSQVLPHCSVSPPSLPPGAPISGMAAQSQAWFHPLSPLPLLPTFSIITRSLGFHLRNLPTSAPFSLSSALGHMNEGKTERVSSAQGPWRGWHLAGDLKGKWEFPSNLRQRKQQLQRHRGWGTWHQGDCGGSWSRRCLVHCQISVPGTDQCGQAPIE